MNFFNYQRRYATEVKIGNIKMGGSHPIVVQTMTSTDTLDTEKSTAQCVRVIEAGAQLVRLTAQGVREAENLRNIRRALADMGYQVPLSADIHFNPRAALTAAETVEKVRINPGNFVDKQKLFATLDYTDEEYAFELEKIRDKVIPFYELCKKNKTAVRIGVNHGSLSDRIMSRYGDTAEGMVESCMEFLRIALEIGFTDIVISMKTSNTLIMTKAVRLMVDTMDKENIHFPLHLGVTEAGDAEDGRIKSAVGIGALLADGIGDTIRVSLSEEPEFEIPVAKKLVKYIAEREDHPKIEAEVCPDFSPFSTERRETYAVRNIGGEFSPIVISDRADSNDHVIDHHFIPDYIYVGNKVPENFTKGMKAIVDFPNINGYVDVFPLFTYKNISEIDSNKSPLRFLRISYMELTDEILSLLKHKTDIVIILQTNHQNGVGEQRAFFHKLLNAKCKVPIVVQRQYHEDETEDLQVKSGADFGAIFLDGFGDGIMLSNSGNIDILDVDRFAFGILQASRIRTTKTEYISCPSCGRTLFDLQRTVATIKESFSHLKHLKIGVMGCIVNGPGEMADADYGYVGSEHGKISLYKKKELIQKNIPQDQAVSHLVQLIKDNGDWIDPPLN